MTNQEKRPDSCSGDTDGHARVATHLLTQAAVLVGRLVGEIFRQVTNLLAAAAIALGKLVGDATGALEQVVACAGRLVCIVANAAGHTVDGALDLLRELAISAHWMAPSQALLTGTDFAAGLVRVV